MQDGLWLVTELYGVALFTFQRKIKKQNLDSASRLPVGERSSALRAQDYSEVERTQKLTHTVSPRTIELSCNAETEHFAAANRIFHVMEASGTLSQTFHDTEASRTYDRTFRDRETSRKEKLLLANDVREDSRLPPTGYIRNPNSEIIINLKTHNYTMNHEPSVRDLILPQDHSC